MATLKKLTDIATPNLIEFEQNEFLDEIINTIKTDPNWDANFDGELTQNATFMLLNMYAFMFSKNAKSFNKQLQEVFYTKANSPFSIVEGLNRIKTNLQQNKASTVQLTGTVENNQFLETTLNINPSTIIEGIDLDGQPTTLEFISIDPISGKPDYINPVSMPLTVANRQRFDLLVYSGITVVQTIQLDATLRENFSISLPDTNVIENSIRIYYNTNTELPESDSFVVPRQNINDTRFLGGTPHYIVQYDVDGKPTVFFGSEVFGGGFAEPDNGTLTIYYRTGGGANTNISKNNISESIIVENNGRELTISFTNNFEGFGGANRENVFEAQIYAPLRYGRGKQIVNDQDALNELRGQLIKHRVDSPKYSEILNTVQLLHAHHYIVPRREFTNFTFPDVLATDNLTSYNSKFLASLNEYMNVQGIHDGEETEFVSQFIQPSVNNPTYSFVSALAKSNPLNRTLSLSAYDYLNNSVDRITFFLNNYSGTNNPPDVLVDKANIKTTAFGTVNVTANNNRIKLRYDKINPIDITLNVGIYTPITLRDEIVNKMLVSGIVYFVANASNLCVNEDNDTTIKFISPISGENSKVEVMSVVNPIYSSIGLTTYQFAYASLNNGTIFTQNTNLNQNTSEILIDINTNYFDDTTENLLSKEDNTWYDIQSWAQDENTSTGTTVTKIITAEDGVKLEKIQTGSDVILKAVNSSGEYVDKIYFPAVQNGSSNAATGYQVAEGNDSAGFNPLNAGTYVFGALSSANFNWNLSELKFKLRNGDLTSYPAPVQTGVNLNLFLITDYVTENDIIVPPYENISGSTPGAYPQIINYTGTTINPYIKKSSVKFYYYDDSAATYYLVAESDSSGNIITPAVPGFTNSELEITGSVNKINYTTGQFEFQLTFKAPFPLPVDVNDSIKIRYTYHTGNGDNITFQIDTPSASPISVAYSIATGDLFTQLTQMLAEGVAKTSTGFEVLSKNSGLVYPAVAISKAGCAITSGSPIINVASTTDINIGMPASGAGIPADSYVISKTPTTITINANATATSGSETVVFNQASVTFVQMADAWAFALREESGISTLFDYISTNANNQILINSQQTNTDSQINIVNVTSVIDPITVFGFQNVPYSHSPEVAEVDHWEVVFKRKTYEYITANYSPNPYFPESEAFSFLMQLNATNRRLLGMENLIKRVEFVPVKVIANLYASQGTSPSFLRQQTQDIIQAQFSYENSVYEQNIGSGFSVARLTSAIGNTSINTGVSFATVLSPSADIQDTTSTKNRYYFVMPSDIINQIKSLESSNSNIAGLSALYEAQINVQNT